MRTNLKMRKRSGILLFFLVNTFFGCGSSQTEDTGAQPEKVPVEVTKVESDTVPRNVELTTTLNPWQEQNIAPQTPGRIEKINVNEGDRVEQGRLLVQMNDADLQQARIQLQSALTEYNRMKRLYDAGAISLQQYENARDQYRNAQTNYDLVLRNTQLRAPFSGIITAKYMNEGEIFTGSPTAQGPPAILTIQQLNVLKATVNLSESFYPQIKEGQKAEVRADVYPDSSFTGEVSNIYPVIDPQTRTFTVEVRIDNAKTILRPGMFARIKMNLGEGEGIIVPKSALTRQPGTDSYYGFVVKNDTARRRQIKTGADFEDNVEVTSGLKEGEILVTTGQGRLMDGTPVTVASQQTEEVVHE